MNVRFIINTREKFLIGVSGLLVLMAAVTANGQDFKYESKGRRDPFAPLVGSGRAVTSELNDILSADELHLEGIAVGKGGRRMAIINGRLVKEGEQVGNVTIEKITDNGVTCSIDGRAYDIDLVKEGGAKGEK